MRIFNTEKCTRDCRPHPDGDCIHDDRVDYSMTEYGAPSHCRCRCHNAHDAEVAYVAWLKEQGYDH